MKRITILMMSCLLFFGAAAQSEYSTCYKERFQAGMNLYNLHQYSQAKAKFMEAKECDMSNKAEADKWIGNCNHKIAEVNSNSPVRNTKVSIDEGGAYMDVTIGEVSFRMIKVEGGTFWMGAQNKDPNGQNYDSKAYDFHGPVHSVNVNTYYIGETEVTQALWEAVMGKTIKQQQYKAHMDGWSLKGEGDNHPMYYLNWNDCQEFIRKLNTLTGKSFRLPTEAEWEYAARGGKYSHGYKYAGSNDIDIVAWYQDKKGGYVTRPVKSKSPNELGLYDMSGNVLEWCDDKVYYYDSSRQVEAQYRQRRMMRGGYFDLPAEYSTVTHRYDQAPDIRYDFCGFRLALTE